MAHEPITYKIRHVVGILKVYWHLRWGGGGDLPECWSRKAGDTSRAVSSRPTEVSISIRGVSTFR
jgi:hypothetical protein